MTEERPRPQFGAYASPEEQLARSGRAAARQVSDPALIPRDMPPEEPAAQNRPGQRESVSQFTLVDRVLTVALMAFGLYSVVGSFRVYTDPYALVEIIGMTGIELTQAGVIHTAGVISVVVMLLGWTGTVWALWKRGARRKSMWWIAVLAGIVFTVVGALIITIPFAMDPAVLQEFATMQGIELPK